MDISLDLNNSMDSPVTPTPTSARSGTTASTITMVAPPAATKTKIMTEQEIENHSNMKFQGYSIDDIDCTPANGEDPIDDFTQIDQSLAFFFSFFFVFIFILFCFHYCCCWLDEYVGKLKGSKRDRKCM